MKNHIAITLLASILGESIAIGQTYTVNSSVDCGHLSMPVSAILEQRIPPIPIETVPFECQNIVKKKLSEFRKNDTQNIERIVSEYCSHKNGWVEYKSGECSAGGPPPICVKEHWYKDMNASINQWNAKIRDLVTSRKGTIKELSCQCLANSVRRAFEKENQNTFKALSSKADLGNDQSQSLKLPCLQIDGADPCPPNYKCEQGFCVSKSAAQTSLSKLNNPVTKELVNSLITDNIVNSVINKYSVTLGRIYERTSPYAAILDPTTISTNANGYSKAANALKENFKDYYQRLLELNRYYQGQNLVRDKSYILDDLNVIKVQMKNNFILLNEFRNGIDVEGKCRNCCNDAFDEYHKQLGTYYSVFSSLKLN